MPQRQSFHEVALAVKDALDNQGVEIPFPQSTLSLRDPDNFQKIFVNDDNKEIGKAAPKLSEDENYNTH